MTIMMMDILIMKDVKVLLEVGSLNIMVNMELEVDTEFMNLFLMS